MAIDKIPQVLETENTDKKVSDIVDYLYYLREQMNYELGVIKKKFEREAKNGEMTAEALDKATNEISGLAERVSALENT